MDGRFIISEDDDSCDFQVAVKLSGLQHYKGAVVAHLVEALRYKPEVRGFDFRWCHWNFSLT
jgi:hypothetical protein